MKTVREDEITQYCIRMKTRTNYEHLSFFNFVERKNENSSLMVLFHFCLVLLFVFVFQSPYSARVTIDAMLALVGFIGFISAVIGCVLSAKKTCRNDADDIMVS